MLFRKAKKYVIQRSQVYTHTWEKKIKIQIRYFAQY